MKTEITVSTTINSPIEKVWAYWTASQHIVNWNFASADWHCPAAENDFKVGGKLSCTMAAKDGSFSFDFWTIYDEIVPLKRIASTMGDGRKMSVVFTTDGAHTILTETFEAEDTFPIEHQRGGWQAILDNFKAYTEAD